MSTQDPPLPRGSRPLTAPEPPRPRGWAPPSTQRETLTPVIGEQKVEDVEKVIGDLAETIAQIVEESSTEIPVEEAPVEPTVEPVPSVELVEDTKTAESAAVIKPKRKG